MWKESSEFYEAFMADIWREFVEQTNIYVQQKKNPAWEKTTVEEVKDSFEWVFKWCIKIAM